MQTSKLPIILDTESPRWLRQLRWLAIVAMSLSVMGAHNYGVDLPLGVIFSLLFLLSIWNTFLPHLADYFFHSLRHYVFFQIVVDIAVLTAILWWTGGYLNPFVSFYVFHMMHAGLLLNGLYTSLVGFIAGLFLLILIWAPGIVVKGQALHFQDSPIWFGIPIGLVILIFCLNLFIQVFLLRLKFAHTEVNRRNKMTATGRLAGGLAHELGTPLNTILVLAKDLESEVSEANKKHLKTIYQQAKRCGDLVALLLGYSAGGEKNFSQVRLEEVELESWLRDIYPAMPFRLIHPDSVPTRIAIPELVLRQVLRNILKNAQQAMANQPNADLELSLGLQEETNTLIITARDNGPGFSEESRERAFEAFYTTKDPGDGMGLGLYISYYLMEQIGGKIEIGSSASGGAEITVWVPYGK